MKQTIKASFKQANVKSGLATLTFEVLTSSEGAFDIIRHSGQNVILGITPEQETLSLDDETGEVLEWRSQRTSSSRCSAPSTSASRPR